MKIKRTTVNIPSTLFDDFKKVCILQDKKHTDELFKLVEHYNKRFAKKLNIKLKEPA